MSPVNAMERSYPVIKAMLRDGVFVTGMRLEANRLAQELGVSMTPVRDALHQLAGEQLVEATVGDGFRVPRLSESALRDLYEWNAALMSLASRTVDIGPALVVATGPVAAAEGFATVVAAIADIVPNKEIGSALLGVSDRLHPFRLVEARVFDDLDAELEDFKNRDGGLPNAIRRFHLRRMRAAADLLRRRDRR